MAAVGVALEASHSRRRGIARDDLPRVRGGHLRSIQPGNRRPAARRARPRRAARLCTAADARVGPAGDDERGDRTVERRGLRPAGTRRASGRVRGGQERPRTDSARRRSHGAAGAGDVRVAGGAARQPGRLLPHHAARGGRQARAHRHSGSAAGDRADVRISGETAASPAQHHSPSGAGGGAGHRGPAFLLASGRRRHSHGRRARHQCLRRSAVPGGREHHHAAARPQLLPDRRDGRGAADAASGRFGASCRNSSWP